MEKNKTGLYTGIAVVVVVIIAIVVGVIINNNRSTPEEISEESEPQVIVDDVETIDATVEYGDFEGMAMLAKDIQNGDATGKTVKIEGLVSHPMSTYSVVQENEDGTKSIGTQFIINGVEEEDYPQDGDRIVIIGRIVEKDTLVYVIEAVPENVQIK